MFYTTDHDISDLLKTKNDGKECYSFLVALLYHTQCYFTLLLLKFLFIYKRLFFPSFLPSFLCFVPPYHLSLPLVLPFGARECP